MRPRTDAEWIIRLIQPHVDEYKKLAAEYNAIAAENERLRKAGDAMASYLDEWDYRESLINAWNAAKEGRDAK